MVPVGVALHTDDAPSVHQSQSSHALLCRSCHSKFAFCPSKLVISPKLPARQCSITRHCCAMPIHPHPPFCREQRPFYFFVPLHPCFCPVTLVLGLSCSRARPLLLIFLYFPLFIINFFFHCNHPPFVPLSPLVSPRLLTPRSLAHAREVIHPCQSIDEHTQYASPLLPDFAKTHTENHVCSVLTCEGLVVQVGAKYQAPPYSTLCAPCS